MGKMPPQFDPVGRSAHAQPASSSIVHTPPQFVPNNLPMRPTTYRRLVLFWTVVAVALALWILRGFGLLTIVPGFIVMGLWVLAWIIALVNGLIETR